jgi:EF hand.
MNPPRNWLVTLLTASFVGICTGTLAAAPDNGAPTSATPDANATPTAATSAPPTAGTTTAPAAVTPGTNAPSNNPSAASATDASKDTQAKKIFDQLDTNHDGALSFEEFSRATFQSK